MRHFKTQNGSIRGIDLDQENLIEDGWVELSDAELKIELDKLIPPKTPKQILSETLQTLTHDFGDGRVMQVRPQDEQNIRNALEIMQRNSMTEMQWRMADNVSYTVSINELTEALHTGQDLAAAAWNVYLQS